MKDFFLKHGNSSYQPQDAIEMLVQKVDKIREMIYQEDELHLEELRLLSEMIDDYVREVTGMGYQFQKKEYQDMSSRYNPYGGMYNNVYPIYYENRPDQGGQSTRQQQQGQPGQGQQGGQQGGQGGTVGYRHGYPIYPIYPFGAANRPNYPR